MKYKLSKETARRIRMLMVLNPHGFLGWMQTDGPLRPARLDDMITVKFPEYKKWKRISALDKNEIGGPCD